MYQFYGKINRGQVSRPLYRDCPLFGGSVIRGFTVVNNVLPPTSILARKETGIKESTFIGLNFRESP